MFTMKNSVESKTRRSVRGLACRDCEFCGRVRTDQTGELNYQYVSEATGEWDNHVFCSKICYSAWHTLNGGR